MREIIENEWRKLTITGELCRDEPSTSTHQLLDCRVSICYPAIKRTDELEAAARDAVIHYMLSCRMSVNRKHIRVAPSVQLDYEDALVEVHIKVAKQCVDVCARHALASKLIRRWCALDVLDGDRTHAPSLIIDNDDVYIDAHEPALFDHTVMSISLGHMPNHGEFHSCFTSKARLIDADLYISDTVPFSIWTSFEHDRREMSVYIVADNIAYTGPAVEHEQTKYIIYKLVVPYMAIEHITYEYASGGQDSPTHNLYVRLKHPPQLWRAVPRPADMLRQQRFAQLSYKRCNDWERVTSIVSSDNRAPLDQTALASIDTICIRNYVVIYPPRMPSARDRYAYCIHDVHGNALIQHKCYHDDECDCEQPLITAETQLPSSDERIASLLSRLRTRLPAQAVIDVRRVHFNVDALVDYNVLPWRDVDMFKEPALSLRPRVIAVQMRDSFLVQVRDCALLDASATEQALEQMLIAVDQNRRITLNYALLMLFNLIRASPERAPPPLLDNCCYVRKVLVSPTRALLMPAEVMMTNRVVRQFGQDYLLRCVFRDDDWTRLNNFKFRTLFKSIDIGDGDVNASRVASAFSELVHNTLHRQGVSAGGRTYRFLGWSNSQMRDHGCYLVSPIPIANLPDVAIAVQDFPALRKTHTHGDEMFDARTLRAYLGDFTNCESLPKMMSRIGQCFSQALVTIDMRTVRWTCEADVIGGAGNDYTFSDGVGRMSSRTAAAIAKHLPECVDYVPCAVQVRFKGYKGMLCLDPMLDIIDCYHVIFRDSQCKFQDVYETSHHLEVVKYSMPTEVCLNRPFINIVDQVSAHQQEQYAAGARVHERVCMFVQLVCEHEMYACADMLTDEVKSVTALRERLSIPIDACRLSRAGVRLTSEPFFRSLLIAAHKYTMLQQISRAKVPVPTTYGRTMYGVMDDSGTLMPGTVFVRYSTDMHRPCAHATVVTGTVLVTKNPCLIAGDVRVFTAVDATHLYHLCDVIVFPRYGQRPHADEMAGSDLDGDEYSVFWHPLMLFDHNESPMQFPSLKADPLNGHAPTDDEMAKFFVDYLSQDMIGAIGAAHLAQSDRFGIFSDVSERIARKNAIALDFPKTGKPARQLARSEQADIRPDFKMSLGKRAYMSRRLAGRIYRQSYCVEQMLHLARDVFDEAQSIDADLCVNEWADVLHADDVVRAAIRVRDRYFSHIQKLLDTYGIENEAQLVSGQLSNLRNRLTEQDKDDYSYYNTDKVVQLRYAQVFTRFREIFFEEYGSIDEYISSETGEIQTLPLSMRQKALVWYTITYRMTEYDNHRRYRSFPWLVWDILAYHKRALTYTRQHSVATAPPTNPVHERIGAELLHAFELAGGSDMNGEVLCPSMRQLRIVYERELLVKLPPVREYSHAYGIPFDACVLALVHWAVQEHVTCTGAHPVQPEDLCALIVAIVNGQVQFDSTIVLNTVTEQPVKPLLRHVADMSTNASCARGHAFDRTVHGSPAELCARLTLCILRQLSSVHFRTSPAITLSLPELPPWVGRLRDCRQHYLSVCAFAAYTRISLEASGVHALHLAGGKVCRQRVDTVLIFDMQTNNDDVSIETTSCILVQVEQPTEPNDILHIQNTLKVHCVHAHVPCTTAQAWSHCAWVSMRSRQQRASGGTNAYRLPATAEYWVSARGTLDALQRLHVVLMMADWQTRVRTGLAPTYDMLCALF